MFLPISVVLAFILWLFMTWIKLRVSKGYYRDTNKYKMDEKLLASLQNNGRSKQAAAEALEGLKKKRRAEEDAKIKANLGKNIFQELDERRKGKGQQRKSRTFDPDLFHDPVSRMYHQSKKEKAEVSKEVSKLDGASVMIKAIRNEMKTSNRKHCRRDK